MSDLADKYEVKASCHPDRKHKARGMCQECYLASRASIRQEYYYANKEKHNTRVREYSWALRGVDPNFTEQDYQQLLKKQDGVCAICEETNSNGNRLYLDHDHKTGKVRGLLCNMCNRFLHENITTDILFKMNNYIHGIEVKSWL